MVEEQGERVDAGGEGQEEGEHVAQPQRGVVGKGSKGGRYLGERSKAL